MMNHQYFDTRTEARAEAQKMREHGWPDATAVQIVTDEGNKWVVRAWQNQAGDVGFLRDDGFVN